MKHILNQTPRFMTDALEVTETDRSRLVRQVMELQEEVAHLRLDIRRRDEIISTLSGMYRNESNSTD